MDFDGTIFSHFALQFLCLALSFKKILSHSASYCYRKTGINNETKQNYKSQTVLQVYVYDIFTLVIVFVGPPPLLTVLCAHTPCHVHIPKEIKRLTKFLGKKHLKSFKKHSFDNLEGHITSSNEEKVIWKYYRAKFNVRVIKQISW